MKFKPLEECLAIPLRNGLTKPKKVRGQGYKMVNMGELFSTPIINELEMDRVPLTDKEKVSLLEAGDLLFARQSLVREGAGQCSIFWDDAEEVCFESHIIRCRIDRQKADPLFLFYYFQSKLGKSNVDCYVEQGAGAAGIRGTDLLKVLVPDIDVEHQRKVAKALYQLDRKIKNNFLVNQTLEQMAQAIFKSWFVDFDPVKAKMNGEQPDGMDAVTASLFPEKLVESELGLIPEGWKVSSLSELIKLTGGGTPKRSEETYWNGDIPWFSVKDVPSGSNVFVVDTDEKITELGLNKSSTKLLPKGTTIITARGTVGKLALVGTDMCMNQSCYGIRGKEIGDYYNYFNLKEAVSTLQRNTHGAVFDTITTKTFDTYSLAFGGVELADRFEDLIAPLLQKIESNVRQNIELSALRDTLLPKLLSGEVELNEV
ncbi:restriction endonuclease subunit S [Vibrio mytili]|uniref:restriction endonuclease subunit S n=1 Tax=Vibrio mytili TaxID=50718 RepID=UPI002F426CEE